MGEVQFGVKLAEEKTLDDFFDCFEPLHSKLESEKDLDVHVPVTLIKPIEYAFYNMSLEDAYQNGESVFRPEDNIYKVIVNTTVSTIMEGNLLDNNRNNSIVFTDDIGKAMKWEEQMYKQKEPANLSPDPKPVTPSKDLGKQ